ncbi:MAG: hypothetical protein RLZZ306_3366 [Bacteroidota bacterium]|jgi:hypothetical protein
MKKFFFKWQVIVADTNELAIKFKITYDKYGNVPVDFEYVKNCLVIMVYKNSRLIGGEILNGGKYPFRYFEIFKNDEEKKAILTNEGLDESSLMEITSIWHIKNLPILDKLIFFLITCWQAWMYAKKNHKIYIIGGSLIKKVQEKQMGVMKKLIVSMPIDTSVLNSKGETSGVAKIYGAKTKHFFSNVILAVLKELINLPLKSTLKLAHKLFF